MKDVTPVLDHLAATRAHARARLFDFLRIPSVSAQPAHAADCVRAAEWVADHLRGSGFEARLCQTGGHPVVVAHHPGRPGAEGGPHLLYYGHYDVQPAEPLELWDSPPFEPVVVRGRHGEKIVARGAVDDKGQVAMWLEAFRAWHEAGGGMPARITVLIEGEEEVGSANLNAFLAANKAELTADAAVVSDTGMWDIDTPAITTRLRGLVYAEVRLRAAKRDLHSGIFGGSALNPINALTRILAGLWDADGRVALPGFYDGVAELSAAEAAGWDALQFDETAFLGEIGLRLPAGELGRSGLVRLWARPTADVNGIWGGYAGEGPKTVIAAEAGAKVSFRLVGAQDPAAVFAAFEAFVRARTPADAMVSVLRHSGDPAVVVPSDGALAQAAARALEEEYGRAPVMIGCGGSIPVVESFKRILGLDTLLMGFGLEDDQVHSPNEKFEVRCLEHGTRAHARLLGQLATSERLGGQRPPKPRHH